MRALLWWLILVSASSAQSGSFTTFTMNWGGALRQYSVYAPPILRNPAPAFVCLHGTVKDNNGTTPPISWCEQALGWERVADRYGFLLVFPVSTWNSANGGQWYWNAYNLSPLFANPPDDSGFVRAVIQQVKARYVVDAARIDVVGMSSGAFMAHRVAMDSSDLIAAIAPVAGQVWADSNTLPNITAPVSVLEYHGDKDSVVNYCGGKIVAWGPSISLASVDDDLNYWLAQNKMNANPTPLCTSGQVSPGVFFLHFKGRNGTEVAFLRELGFNHLYDTGVNHAIYEFFIAHPKVKRFN